MIWRGQADGQTVEADDGRGEAGTQGRRAEASPRADLAGGWGGCPYQMRLTGWRTAADGGRSLLIMVETAPGCWAIMPQIIAGY